MSFPNRDPKKVNKKKTLRIEKAIKRIMSKGKSEEEAIQILKSKKITPGPKTLEELLKECEKPSVKHKLEVTFQSLPLHLVEPVIKLIVCSDQIGSI